MRFKNKRYSRGVAILTVLVSLALMIAIVTELSSKEVTRYKLAINERDALQAEALAQSGANFAKLILTVQEPLQTYMANFAKMGIQLPSFAVWQLMPLDSDLLKGITDGSFMPDFGFDGKKKDNEKGNRTSEKTKEKDAKYAAQAKKDETESKDKPLFGPYEAPEGGYGGFRGRFFSDISDEEQYFSIRGWQKLDNPSRKAVADVMFRILSKPENSVLFDGSLGRNNTINPSQLIGNIYDYLADEDLAVDVSAPAKDWGRILAGDKKSIYADSPGLGPKRAPLDSPEELRFVPGMSDAIYRVLSKHITIYGESGKVNILTAKDEVLANVFYLCAKNRETSPFQRAGFDEQVLADWNRKRNEGVLDISLDGIMAHLAEHNVEVDKEECTKRVGTESKTFTVRSTATVGNVTKTVLMRLRSAGGITTIYQYQYL